MIMAVNNPSLILIPRSDSSNPLSPTSPPPVLTTAELLEANKQKRLYAREEFLHQNSSVKDSRNSKSKPANDIGRRRFRDSHQQDADAPKRHDMRSASIDSEDVFSTGSSSRRRMSSPFSLNNVLTASLKIPVQMSNVSNVGDEMVNIPYIEDNSGEYSTTSGEWLLIEVDNGRSNKIECHPRNGKERNWSIPGCPDGLEKEQQ